MEEASTGDAFRQPLGVKGSSGGAAGPSTKSGSASRVRMERAGVWIAVIAIAITVVILVAALIPDVAPGFLGTRGRPYPGEQLTYNQAAPMADIVAEFSPDGPWTPIADEGVNSRAALSWVVPLLTCQDPASVGPPHYLSNARPSVPPEGGSSAPGAYSWWSFLYSNGTTDAENQTFILDVGVVNGTAIAIATFTTVCYLGSTGFYALPATVQVDSSAAQATGMAQNSTFFDTYPQFNVTASLVHFSGVMAPLGWLWSIIFTTCPVGHVLPSSDSTYLGVYYGATINATTGVGISSTTPSELTCV